MYYVLCFAMVFLNIVLAIIRCFCTESGLEYVINFRDMQDLLILIVTPLMLVIFSVWNIRTKNLKYRACIMAVVITILLNSIVSYIDWGVRTNLLLNPDAETIMVSLYIETIFPIVITLLLIGIYKLLRR